MAEKRTAIYPGTFDPITLGHLDIIRRATRLVDHLVVAVAVNAGKGPMFTVDERVEMVREAVQPCLGNGCSIEAESFDNLLVDFAEDHGAQMVIRGLRAVSDFEYEFQMASMNARLKPHIETVFLTASERQQFVASRLVKEIARLDGNVSSFVPAPVHERLLRRIAEEKESGGG